MPKQLLALFSFCFLLAVGGIAADIHPIVDTETGFVLGAVSAGKWITHETAGKALKGERKYRVYSLNEALGTVAGGKPKPVGQPGEPYDDFHQVPLKDSPKGGVIALGVDGNAMPRNPRIASNDQPVYLKAVAEFLESRGLKGPKVKVTQIIRIDLEGDGEDEVLISGTNYLTKDGSIPTESPAGSYSFVLMRRLVKGSVTTQLVDGEFYPKAKTFNAPSRYRVVAVLDLNGDGKMEILVHSQYYEGDCTTIWDCTGRKPVKLLEAGGGA